jgi:hypothetical protein
MVVWGAASDIGAGDSAGVESSGSGGVAGAGSSLDPAGFGTFQVSSQALHRYMTTSDVRTVTRTSAV